MPTPYYEALAGPAPVGVLLITVSLPDYTIRWTDGGFVVWGGETYQEVDDTYGVVSRLDDIEDGVSDQTTDWSFVIMASLEAISELAAPLAQGSPVTVHLGAVDRATGLLIGDPDPMHRVELDRPRLTVGSSAPLTYDCITEEARTLEASEEQRLTDAFHKSVWPGERAYESVTAVERELFWRADDPRNAIG